MKSVKVETIKKLFNNSYQEAIQVANDRVNKLSAGREQLFLLHENGITTVDESGEFRQYQYSFEHGIGQAVEHNIRTFDVVDEAIELIEKSKRIIEHLTVGNMDQFNKSLLHLIASADEKHLNASKFLGERLTENLSENSWIKQLDEKTVPMRRVMYGVLGSLKERELKHKYWRAQLNETNRRDVVRSINIVVKRLNEQVLTLSPILSQIKHDSDVGFSGVDELKAFCSGIIDSAKDLGHILEQKLKLDGSNVDVMELAGVYENVVERVNKIDFCTKFLEKVAMP